MRAQGFRGLSSGARQELCRFERRRRKTEFVRQLRQPAVFSEVCQRRREYRAQLRGGFRRGADDRRQRVFERCRRDALFGEQRKDFLERRFRTREQLTQLRSERSAGQLFDHARQLTGRRAENRFELRDRQQLKHFARLPARVRDGHRRRRRNRRFFRRDAHARARRFSGRRCRQRGEGADACRRKGPSGSMAHAALRSPAAGQIKLPEIKLPAHLAPPPRRVIRAP